MKKFPYRLSFPTQESYFSFYLSMTSFIIKGLHFLQETPSLSTSSQEQIESQITLSLSTLLTITMNIHSRDLVSSELDIDQCFPTDFQQEAVLLFQDQLKQLLALCTETNFINQSTHVTCMYFINQLLAHAEYTSFR